jgi:hypothetical protein
MAKNNHPLAIFGGGTTKGTGFNGREWNISLIDQSEYVCAPERDRRIIYSAAKEGECAPSAEARIREARNGSKLELLIFVWSDAAYDSEHGIKVIHEDVPDGSLETKKQRRAYLKYVARLTETLAKRMGELDKAIDAGVKKLGSF